MDENQLLTTGNMNRAIHSPRSCSTFFFKLPYLALCLQSSTKKKAMRHLAGFVGTNLVIVCRPFVTSQVVSIPQQTLRSRKSGSKCGCVFFSGVFQGAEMQCNAM